MLTKTASKNFLQGYESFGLILDAFEREHADSGNDIESMRQLEHANSQHVTKIAMLERQLHDQVAETKKLKAALGRMQERRRVAENDPDKVREESAIRAQAAETEKTAREEEVRLRNQAEA